MTATAERTRNRLVHELTGHGRLTEAWRAAFAAVPRHLFLPRFFRQTPDRSRYEAVDANDPGALELIYSDRVLPTQLDGDDARWDESRRHGPIDGVPTCSSTQPALMAVMLDALDVTDGHRVLEVGTGTGYNAALLAHRLGSPLVTTVDIDAGLVRRARRSLAAVGYAPTVAATDGAAGHPGNAPYDRIIAACSVPQVPAGWLAQTRPGGVILTSLHREIGGGLLLRLTVDETGAASGHLLDDSARSCRCAPAPPCEPRRSSAPLPRPPGTGTRPTYPARWPTTARRGPRWWRCTCRVWPASTSTARTARCSGSSTRMVRGRTTTSPPAWWNRAAHGGCGPRWRTSTAGGARMANPTARTSV